MWVCEKGPFILGPNCMLLRRNKEIIRISSFCTDRISGKQLKRTHIYIFIHPLNFAKCSKHANKPVSRKKSLIGTDNEQGHVGSIHAQRKNQFFSYEKSAQKWKSEQTQVISISH
jgi:hypothetical protein